MSNLLPEWLTQPFFFGRDPESEDDSEDEGDDGQEDEDSGEDSEDEGEEGNDEGDEDEEDEEDDSKDDAYEGLRTALTKERKLHRTEKRGRIKAERELEAANAKLAAGTNKESEAINDLQTRLDGALEKNTSLARSLAKQAVHTAIKEAAGKAGFIDPEDALSVARDIEVDQDDDDPTQVEVDKALVKAAVMALAKKKPHLVNKKQQDRVVSGSSARRTNGSRPRSKTSKGAKQKELLERYPSLQ